MSAVQYNGDPTEVEAKYPSLTLWTDGDNNTYYEENGERNYLKSGDWVVLEGGKHVVQSDYKEPKSPTKATKPANDETTEMKPAEGSATTDDRA